MLAYLSDNRLNTPFVIIGQVCRNLRCHHPTCPNILSENETNQENNLSCTKFSQFYNQREDDMVGPWITTMHLVDQTVLSNVKTYNNRIEFTFTEVPNNKTDIQNF